MNVITFTSGWVYVKVRGAPFREFGRLAPKIFAIFYLTSRVRAVSERFRDSAPAAHLHGGNRDIGETRARISIKSGTGVPLFWGGTPIFRNRRTF